MSFYYFLCNYFYIAHNQFVVFDKKKVTLLKIFNESKRRCLKLFFTHIRRSDFLNYYDFSSVLNGNDRNSSLKLAGFLHMLSGRRDRISEVIEATVKNVDDTQLENDPLEFR